MKKAGLLSKEEVEKERLLRMLHMGILKKEMAVQELRMKELQREMRKVVAKLKRH